MTDLDDEAATVRVRFGNDGVWFRTGREQLPFPTELDGFRYILALFEHGHRKEHAHMGGPAGAVHVFARPDHRLVVVGWMGDLAQNVRGMLPQQGWSLVDGLPGPTPLIIMRDRLGSRLYNLLDRQGFTTVEEVAAVPDSGLCCLPGMGLSSLARTRLAITMTSTDLPGPITLTPAQLAQLRILLQDLTAHLTRTHSPELINRVDEFVAQSLIPATPGQNV